MTKLLEAANEERAILAEMDNLQSKMKFIGEMVLSTDFDNDDKVELIGIAVGVLDADVVYTNKD